MSSIIGAVRALLRLFDPTPEPPPCPMCRELRLVEFDAILRRWICNVCCHQWRASIE